MCTVQYVSMSGHLGGPHAPRMYCTVHVDIAIFILYVWCTAVHRNSETQLYSRRGGGAHASAPILVCARNRQPRCAFDAGGGDGAWRVGDPQSLPFAVRGPWPLTIPFAARQGARSGSQRVTLSDCRRPTSPWGPLADLSRGGSNGNNARGAQGGPAPRPRVKGHDRRRDRHDGGGTATRATRSSRRRHPPSDHNAIRGGRSSRARCTDVLGASVPPPA